MSIKVKTLAIIATIAFSIATSGTAFSKERSYNQNYGQNVIVRGHDRIMFPPVISRGQIYHKAHARQFNDRQYLRMQKHRKMKRKIRRIKRLNNVRHIDRPIIIVTRPRY